MTHTTHSKLGYTYGMPFNATKVLYHLSRSAQWRDASPLCEGLFDPHIWTWLNDQQSLTQRLIDVSNGAFTVDLLMQKVGIPLWHEQDCLQQFHHLAATVREVCLNIHAEPIVLARSIIPLSLIRQHQNGLTDLGRQPLGQLLFREGRVRVSRRQFTQVSFGKSTVYGRRILSIKKAELYSTFLRANVWPFNDINT